MGGSDDLAASPLVTVMVSYLGHWVYHLLTFFRASLVVQLVKNLPAMWETWIRSLGWKDPLEK